MIISKPNDIKLVVISSHNWLNYEVHEMKKWTDQGDIFMEIHKMVQGKRNTI